MGNKTRLTFTVKEAEDGTPSINMEFHDAVEGLPSDPPVFDLPPNTSLSDAKKIARYLNENIASYRPFPSRF